MGMARSGSGGGRRRTIALAATALVVSGLPLLAPSAAPVQAQTTGLLFSEYIEGSSNNKALEIYNGTGEDVDLTASAYSVQMFFNGSPTAGLTVNLTGTVATGDVFVLAQAMANETIRAQADQTNGSGWFNGDDAIALRQGTTVLDVIGQIGSDPGTEWGTGLTSTADNTLQRLASVCSGDTNGADAFDPAVQWTGLATDTFDGLGAHVADCGGGPPPDSAPGVTSVSPADGTTNVGVASNLTVAFTEPVAVSGSWFTLSCATSGAHTGATSGGPTTFTIDPDTDFANSESCTLTVVAAQVSDADTADPPDTMAADFASDFSTVAADPCTGPITRIPAIQGSGPTAAITGTVTTRGVVVSDDDGGAPGLRGFNLQDVTGDGDPATSDGIFVFNAANTNVVSVGDLVTVTGRAAEFSGQTQIDQLQSVVLCGTATVAPTDVTLPTTDLERFEGMLVRMPQTLYVTEHFQLGRFGEVVVSSGDRLYQPTNVVLPGAPAQALQTANDRNRIIVDDNQTNQNPDPIKIARNKQSLSASNTLRGGDTITGVIGVMSFSFSAYRIMPFNALGGGAPNFVATNPRPATPPVVGGSMQVAGMNLLNYFNSFNPSCRAGVAGPPIDCRGADNADEFARQWPKTVAAIIGTGAEVIGVNEIENDGYGPDSSLAHLVARLNEATAPGTYAFLDVDARTGQINAMGTDAIKVGIIYQPGKVTPIGDTGALNSVEFVNGGDPAPRSRPALAQAFRERATGGVFSVVVNHLKSKGSACSAPDAGDGQGNCNQVRLNAVNELIEWLATDPTGTGDPDYLLVGDLNSYAMEDPIRRLQEAGYTNLVRQFNGERAYSYVFNGQWGYLDHALGSPSAVSQVTGVGEWHINADEPTVLDYNTNFKTANLINTLYAPDQYRVSDHDPIIVGLNLAARTGSVIGSGSITSPPGALRAQPAATGRASFGLTAGNQGGATRTSGAFNFSFSAGRFQVTATSPEYLVINGATVLVGGPARVNRADGYRFEVFVRDAPTDEFRLVVRDGTGAVIYDSGRQPVTGTVRVTPS